MTADLHHFPATNGISEAAEATVKFPRTQLFWMMKMIWKTVMNGIRWIFQRVKIPIDQKTELKQHTAPFLWNGESCKRRMDREFFSISQKLTVPFSFQHAEKGIE
jgi:hypothetical protein